MKVSIFTGSETDGRFKHLPGPFQAGGTAESAPEKKDPRRDGGRNTWFGIRGGGAQRRVRTRECSSALNYLHWTIYTGRYIGRPDCKHSTYALKIAYNRQKPHCLPTAGFGVRTEGGRGAAGRKGQQRDLVTRRVCSTNTDREL
jgi:hypothetical protein